MGRITFFIAYSIIICIFLYALEPFCDLLANAIDEFVKKTIDEYVKKKEVDKDG